MSDPTPIRLLIAERNPNLRDALAEYFNLEEDIDIVGQTSDNTQIYELCRQLKPDVLLIDPALQPNDREPLIRALRQEYPRTKMIVLTSPFNGITRESILEAGANDYAEKGIFASDLVNLIRQVHNQPN
jgi:DNA-binding NarL/FixJ family response regulator